MRRCDGRSWACRRRVHCHCGWRWCRSRCCDRRQSFLPCLGKASWRRTAFTCRFCSSGRCGIRMVPTSCSGCFCTGFSVHRHGAMDYRSMGLGRAGDPGLSSQATGCCYHKSSTMPFGNENCDTTYIAVVVVALNLLEKTHSCNRGSSDRRRHRRTWSSASNLSNDPIRIHPLSDGSPGVR